MFSYWGPVTFQGRAVKLREGTNPDIVTSENKSKIPSASHCQSLLIGVGFDVVIFHSPISRQAKSPGFVARYIKVEPYHRYKWKDLGSPYKWPKINGFHGGFFFHPEMSGVERGPYL